MQLTCEMQRAMRRKRADGILTLKQASEKVGLSCRQYSYLEKVGKDVTVRTKTFEKITLWLLNED